MYGNFFSLDLCLHIQIVQDGNSSLANKCERWNDRMRMGQRKCTSRPLQRQRSFWNSKCYEWRQVNTDKKSVTGVMLKTIRCLIFPFRATNAVLDPYRAQPSWRPWSQERPLLKILRAPPEIFIEAERTRSDLEKFRTHSSVTMSSTGKVTNLRAQSYPVSSDLVHNL